jgi:RNA polymerase sigma factor (TIGR02999 family)
MSSPGVRHTALSSLPERDVTGLLLAWREGDHAALEELVSILHGELHQLAKRMMARERRGHTLQATALVNEAYLRLVDAHRVQWRNRAHFLAVSAQIMRRILVEFARSQHRRKRGGGIRPVALEEALNEMGGRIDANLVALDDALRVLTEKDPRLGQVVELRFFGGLSVEESAEVLGVSAATVMRDWKLAKIWLLRELRR